MEKLDLRDLLGLRDLPERLEHREVLLFRTIRRLQQQCGQLLIISVGTSTHSFYSTLIQGHLFIRPSPL